MKFKNKENKRIIHKETEYWISRSVAVFAIIVFKIKDEHKVLIVKGGEACPDNVGKWCLPCGYLDWDEDGSEAITREIWEETQIDITKYKKNIIKNHLFDADPIIIKTTPNENRQNVSLGYALIIESPTLPDLSFKNEETSEIQLVSLKNVSNYEFAFNHDKRINFFLKNNCN